MNTHNCRMASDNDPDDRPRPFWFLSALIVMTFFAATAARAEDGNSGPPITKIEEDWRIEFGTPDPDTNAPQVVMTMTPTGNIEGHHAVFEVNHRTFPNYSAGGLQLQRWWGDSVVDYGSPHDHSVLQVDNDVMTFTMSMKLVDGYLRFAIKNVNSATWDNFSWNDSLILWTWFGEDNFNSYNPDASLTHSRVGFASHRVKKVIRTQVRYYSGTNLVNTNSQQSIIHQYGEGE